MLNNHLKNLPQIFSLIIDNKGRGEGVKAEVSADGEEATLFIYDVINSWYGISPQDIANALSDIKAETIHLRINCPGGNVFDARAIKTLIDQHSAKDQTTNGINSVAITQKNLLLFKPSVISLLPYVSQRFWLLCSH